MAVMVAMVRVAAQLETVVMVALADPQSPAAEQYRVLYHRLVRLGARRPARVVAVTSSGRGEGRTTTAANLALTAVREGREVLLVECDLRRPRMAQLLDLSPRAGLADVAAGHAELSQALCRVDGLSALCAGEATDPVVLRSARVASAIDAVRGSFSLVVIDAPPALTLNDAGRLASAADGFVLVVRAGETPRDVVKVAMDAIPDRLLGIVLNGVDEPGYARYLAHEAVAV